MGDIVSLPIAILPAAKALWVVALGAYAVRSAHAWITKRANPGKDLVVITTAIAWYVGIVVFDSDYAFTVTNVFMHGIPYFVLVRAQTRKSVSDGARGSGNIASRLSKSIIAFVGVLWLVAFFEELLWDRAIWHDRSWIFGESWDVSESAKLVIVPLLALPQLTHYVLDGFIWRRRENPGLASPVTPTEAGSRTDRHVTLSTSSP